MEDVSPRKKSCAVCQSGSNIKRCNRCKSIYYCSRAHQKQDWSNHKKCCSSKKKDEGAQVKDETNSEIESPNKLITSENEESQEIASILNFDSIKHEIDISENNTSMPTSKEIFNDLINSSGDEYMGPSTDAIISGGEEAMLDAVNEQPSTSGTKDSQNTLEVFNDVEYSMNQRLHSEDEDFVPFDHRPLRRLKFPSPDSYDHKDLAEFIGLRLINLGYCVVDNVFSEEDINGLMAEIKSLESNNELKTGQIGGGRTSAEDDKKSTRTHIRSDKMKWIQGDEDELKYASKAITVMDSIVQFLGPYLRVKGYGNIEGRSKAMLTCYPGNGTFYRRHIDNPNKDGRRITCILYLNKDWDVETDGGLLRILPPSQDKPVDIPPKANRLLYFWSDKRNPHEVHPAYKERFAMTVWYFDTEERTASKIHKMQAETDSIKEKITELEEKRKQMEEATRLQQLQNKAMEAVRSLSEEELQAISVLVHTHPQPRQILTGMGISSHIQDALIQYLTNT